MTQNVASCTQLALDLFPPPSFEELLSQRHTDNISVVVSRRLRRGWHATLDAKTGSRRLSVPALLSRAPCEIKTALIDWALLPTQCRGQVLRRRKKNLERLIYDHITASGTETRNCSTFDPRLYSTQGRVYDLKEVFAALNGRFFNNAISSYVRWGRHPLRSYQSSRRGPAGEKYNLITIGAIYNGPHVPRYAIEGIIFHEMLHIALPPLISDARNVIHGPEFKQRERSFPQHEDWLEWEKTQCKWTTRRV
jgi:hypothetical protein